MTDLRQFFYIAPSADEKEVFRKMINVSVALHVTLLLFFGVKASFFSSESIELDPTIRVDMVGLPDKLAQLPVLPKSEEKPVEKTETKPMPKVEPKAAEKQSAKPVVILHPKHDTSKSLEKIREMEKQDRRKKALEAIRKEVTAEEQKAERQAKVSQILKGNAVNSGSSLHGLMKSEFNDYANEIHNQIHQHWNLPEWLTSDNLKATVVLFLDPQGNVIKRVLRKSSGDERFDNYALKAVDDSSPFPKPPEKFIELVKGDGIVIGFPQ